MRKKLFVALVVMVSFAGLSYAMMGGSTCPTLPKEIKLTREQKSKFDEINLECKKASVKLHADIKVARLDLHALLKKDSIDKTAIDAKVNDIAELIKKAMKNDIDCKVKTLSLLDSEQKKVYLESMHDHCGDGHHHGHPEKGGYSCETKKERPAGMKGMGSSEKMPH